MFHILIVCTANICRSPVAQEFLGKALGDSLFSVESAGTLAIDGKPADSNMRLLMEEAGYTGIALHRSKCLMPHHLKRFQLILCMERTHIVEIHANSIAARGKTMLLGHWSEGAEVNDPVGGSRAEYVAAIDEIRKYCLQWTNKIISMGIAA